MSGDRFGVSLTELAEIQRDWQQMSERMAEMSAKLGQIKGTVAKAVATDLMAAPFAGIVGFAAVAGQVAGEVAEINERTERLQQTKEKLTRAIAEDVRKLQSVLKAYQEADRQIEQDQRNQEKDRQQPDKPKPTGNGDGHGTGKGNGHGNGNGGNDSGGDHHGDKGGDDPDAKPSHEGKIPVKDVEYGGRGSWKSGEAAVRDYISQTLDLMGITDPQAREQWTKGLLTMAGRESSFNSLPLANGWDSNATGPKQSDGFPANSSRGPWQCIPSTFAAYHQQGTSTNIYDPVASCAASMNYMMDRYNVSRDGHDLASKVQQANPGKSARGY
jgi:hypothetical protein